MLGGLPAPHLGKGKSIGIVLYQHGNAKVPAHWSEIVFVPVQNWAVQHLACIVIHES